MTTKTKNYTLDYLIDPKFRNINRLFALSFKNGDDDPTKRFFDEYYMALIKFKGILTLMEDKPCFGQPA